MFLTVSYVVSGFQCNRMSSNIGFAQGRFYCIGSWSLETVDQLLALHTRDLDSHAQLTCSTVRIYWFALQARALTPPSYPSSISPAAEPFDPSVRWLAVYLLLWCYNNNNNNCSFGKLQVFNGSFSYLSLRLTLSKINCKIGTRK